jgi:hypothetical protein
MENTLASMDNLHSIKKMYRHMGITSRKLLSKENKLEMKVTSIMRPTKSKRKLSKD